MSTLLALLGTTMGIGALYYGLPLARYRNELLSNIQSVLAAIQVSDKTARSESIALTATDSNFSSKYHEVAAWYLELPVSARKELSNTTASIFSVVSKASNLPKRYRWFKNGWDKRTTLTFSIVLPLLGLWILFLLPTLAESRWLVFSFSGFLMFSQLWIAVNMMIGVRMVKRTTEEFTKTLDDLISMLGVEGSDEVTSVPAYQDMPNS